ncbi:hypothetical protein [Bradyrhizobium sp. URHD0069]|uniref:hypothetical protein n=1 Tax=Bradyrhizobium sp. URHD0069 TaxID=1380355 RepID=UPI0012DDDCA6|nr:hypothetical protein [Bradyrhizobium sp. URHD0069]
MSEAFIADLKTVWEEDGISALRRCAESEPGTFCRIVSGLLPKNVDVNVSGSVDVGSFAEKFRHALSLLGNEPQSKMRTIEHKATSSAR